ncbi:unnamed protein product [Ranitomeya imitator]|uniref:Uncharacterized protein n=1 Tax=Ranitomeya imitator TaxID=111125 RepID=A0ABN9LF14_9NEOB|nr:unnamed protein product [Ranitomeya imitator]
MLLATLRSQDCIAVSRNRNAWTSHRSVARSGKGLGWILGADGRLVVQLARDLQADFYPHFQDFFKAISSLLDTKDTEQIEWTFTSLSYLYKYLWRMMVKDMPVIYRYLPKTIASFGSVIF